ncbi:LEA type 2 family protein [Polaribacter sargassicola]|uniref:NDR1/HIN1-like protein n=1 Tax=Polaribacter sargassicola TaxID=2836891 RepID=UPI001F15F615|nr:LEA type 2 family protein [Polaribacter sp. DS7-9]MCG1037156.1 LEA type 2 family protein [Polaribacter sp. DS7-9]
MKNFLYFTFIFLLLTSCSVNEQPIFIKVDNVEVVSFTGGEVNLKANALFENPNDVGGKISTDEIAIFVNDIEVAQVSSEEFDVPAKNNFTIPLKAVIPTKKIFEANKNDALGGLLGSLLTNKINVRFKGSLKYAVFGFKSEFLIDEIEEIKIKF